MMQSSAQLFHRDYYKPTKTVDSFDNKKNSYIEYISKGDKYETSSPKWYLDIITTNLGHIIVDHKTSVALPNNKTTSGEWKIQLIMLNNCISNKNFKETRALYSVSNNIETLIGSKTDEFILENVELMYYYLHKTTLKRGYSYIECPE